MAYNIHDLGDLVRVSVAFTVEASGAALDPAVVKLSMKDPAGTVTTYVYGMDAEVVKDGTGLYHADIDADLAGLWHYRWWSTGNGQAAVEKRFQVRAAQAI